MKMLIAKFVTKHGDVFWGPVEANVKFAKLEQYVSVFEYNHDDHGPVYVEI